MPNVLVVMNESYADFSILGSPLNTNQPVTPFADSLQENTQRGHALCSVFGGGTANSEFEFLTGLSMGNLPAGAYSLQENTQRGHALCSVFGGGTANSEFEFLTGLSMGNLPAGACAYQQYIHAPIPSLVHHFNSLGYRTMATHPFLASGWNRTAVYPRLGFGPAPTSSISTLPSPAWCIISTAWATAPWPPTPSSPAAGTVPPSIPGWASRK